MIKTIFFAALVQAVLFKNSHQHLLSFPIFPEERVLPPECSDAIKGTSYCLNCVESEICVIRSGLPKPIQTTCSGSTPVCGLDGSSYACVASNAECQCPGTLGISYKADPFNSHFYTICSGSNTVRADCGIEYYDPQSHSCVSDMPDPPCPSAGVFEDSDPNTCDGFILCASAMDSGTYQKCSGEKNYFNPEISDCDYPVPPFRCQSSGFYVDPFDCRRYYYCNGVNLALVDCCPPAEAFDTTISDCSPITATKPCVALPQCAKSTTTTPTPTTSTTQSSTSSATTSSSTSSTTPSSSASSSTTSSTTTTTLNSGCTPPSNFKCPAPDGFYSQCTYCAQTYFHCVSGTATLKACSGNLLFNTVPSYPACLSTCPYYP